MHSQEYSSAIKQLIKDIIKKFPLEYDEAIEELDNEAKELLAKYEEK